MPRHQKLSPPPPRGCDTHVASAPRLVAQGAACIWTSVLDSDPNQRDDRTDHESLPVESGVKFGVNYWIHMYPFRTMQSGGCDNQAYVQNWPADPNHPLPSS